MSQRHKRRSSMNEAQCTQFAKDAETINDLLTPYLINLSPACADYLAVQAVHMQMIKSLESICGEVPWAMPAIAQSSSDMKLDT